MKNLYLEQASILIITKHPSMMENCPMQSTRQQVVAGWSPKWVMQYQGLCVGLCAVKRHSEMTRLAGHSEWKSMLLRLYIISIPGTMAPFFQSLFCDDGVAIERVWLVSENGSSYPLNYQVLHCWNHPLLTQSWGTNILMHVYKDLSIYFFHISLASIFRILLQNPDHQPNHF